MRTTLLRASTCVFVAPNLLEDTSMSSTRRFTLARMLAFSTALISFSGWVAAATMAYVGNYKDNTVSVIDLSTNKVVATAQGPTA